MTKIQAVALGLLLAWNAALTHTVIVLVKHNVNVLDLMGAHGKAITSQHNLQIAMSKVVHQLMVRELGYDPVEGIEQ